MSETYLTLLLVLNDIRVAAGDANGDLSHAELVERIRGQRRDSERLQAELSELRKDKARLDWLQTLPKMVITKWALQEMMQCEGYNADGRDFCSEEPQLRQAIDAAMKEINVPT